MKILRILLSMIFLLLGVGLLFLLIAHGLGNSTAIGNFFFGSYSYLSYVIPMFYLWIFFILSDSKYEPIRFIWPVVTFVPFYIFTKGLQIQLWDISNAIDTPFSSLISIIGTNATILAVYAAGTLMLLGEVLVYLFIRQNASNEIEEVASIEQQEAEIHSSINTHNDYQSSTIPQPSMYQAPMPIAPIASQQYIPYPPIISSPQQPEKNIEKKLDSYLLILNKKKRERKLVQKNSLVNISDNNQGILHKEKNTKVALSTTSIPTRVFNKRAFNKKSSITQERNRVATIPSTLYVKNTKPIDTVASATQRNLLEDSLNSSINRLQQVLSENTLQKVHTNEVVLLEKEKKTEQSNFSAVNGSDNNILEKSQQELDNFNSTVEKEYSEKSTKYPSENEIVYGNNDDDLSEAGVYGNDDDDLAEAGVYSNNDDDLSEAGVYSNDDDDLSEAGVYSNNDDDLSEAGVYSNDDDDLAEAGVYSNDDDDLAEAGVYSNNDDDLSEAGVYGNNDDDLSEAGVYGNDDDDLAEAGVYGDDDDALAETGVYGDDDDDLSETGVYGNDDDDLSEAGVYGNDDDDLAEAGVYGNDDDALAEAGVYGNDDDDLAEVEVYGNDDDDLAEAGVYGNDDDDLAEAGVYGNSDDDLAEVEVYGNDDDDLAEAGVYGNDDDAFDEAGVYSNNDDDLAEARVYGNDDDDLAEAGVYGNNDDDLDEAGVYSNNDDALAEAGVYGNDDDALAEAGVYDNDDDAAQTYDDPLDEFIEPLSNEYDINNLANSYENHSTQAEPEVIKKPRGAYKIPIFGILDPPIDQQHVDIKLNESVGRLLEITLQEFNIDAKILSIFQGPVITMFEILPAPGVRLSRIEALTDNIALRLAAQSIRIIAPIPGKEAVGIEVPNKTRQIVSFAELITDKEFQKKEIALPIALGKNITDNIQIVDLSRTPHLLIAGATGSGKSVCVNSIICSILYRCNPDEVKLILIDPKIVELSFYNGIAHLLTPVISDANKSLQALRWCVLEMERRYQSLEALNVREIRNYNKKLSEKGVPKSQQMPFIVLVIDEFADLMMTCGKEIESLVSRLTAKSRAIGIHIVVATQRPSTDVITGLIKSNIPTRISFMVTSKTDSRIILDMNGAETLLGRGDMLYSSASDPFPERLQGPYLSEDEVQKIVEYVKDIAGEPEYISEEIFLQENREQDSDESMVADPLWENVIEEVIRAQKASASHLQRRFKIGYNRAARLVEEMEEKGIIGPQQGSKAREVLSSKVVA